MNMLFKLMPIFLMVIALSFLPQVLALSPLTISSSDVGKTAVISGLPEGADVQIVLNNGVPVPMKIGSDGTAKYLLLLEGTLDVRASFKGNAIDNFNITLQSTSTPPPTYGGGGSSSTGSSGEGTYPTFTATPVKGSPTSTLTVTPIGTVKPMTTIEQPTETTVQETQKAIPTTTQKAPGFGILVAIGIIGTIYILRKMK